MRIIDKTPTASSVDFLTTISMTQKLYLQVFQDIRRVGHAEAEHAAVGDDVGEAVEQFGQRRADVAAVGTRVLGREPHLDDALLERLYGPFDDLVWRIAAQLAAGVLRFTVRALVQAPRADGDDLHQRVLANLFCNSHYS